MQLTDSTTPTTADRWPQRIFCIGVGDGSWGLRFHWFGPQSGWTLVLGPFWLSRLGWNGLSFDRELTVAELYTACRNDVLAEHPSAREVARGLTYVAIMAGKELLGSGSTADRAWADAYGRMTGQLT